MKKYDIRYYFDDENYVTRSIDVEDVYDDDDILHEYTKGDSQTFMDVRGKLTRVNMNNVFYTKIWESKRK